MPSSPQSPRPRIAFVVQRCGREVNGGAELHCLRLAQRMSTHWDVEVLTTCARDYMAWENFYPEGTEQLDRVTIRRFAVDSPRDVEQFNRLSEELQKRAASSTIEQQETWMRAQGPLSSGLMDFLARNEGRYERFIFFGYLYATTYFGLPLVRHKALLLPLAHDEWPIHLSMWDRFFALPRLVIFNTEAEKSFLRRRFPHLSLDGPIAAVGIDPPVDANAARFDKRYGLAAPFLLYLGRVDESKGCGTLIDFFARARAERAIPHKLVLAGSEVMPIPFHDDIIYLGFITDEEKWDALSACDWLVMPSQYESLSIALLEAWMVARPALVNGASDVLVAHCQQSNGGLWFESYEQWVTALITVTDATKGALGANGQRYVRENYAWPKIERTYLDCVG